LLQIARLNKISFLAIHELASKYGSISYLWFGTKKVAVVTGTQAVRTILKDATFENLTGPHDTPSLIIRALSGSEESSGKGILVGSGYRWRENRRFTLRALREFGFGKMSTEDYILEEWTHMEKHIK